MYVFMVDFILIPSHGHSTSQLMVQNRLGSLCITQHSIRLVNLRCKTNGGSKMRGAILIYPMTTSLEYPCLPSCLGAFLGKKVGC